MKIILFITIFIYSGLTFSKIFNWKEIESLAIKNSSQIKSIQKQLLQQRKNKHAAYAGHLPSIHLFAQEFDTKNTIKNTTEIVTNVDGRKYGIQASINIFDGMNTTMNIKKANKLELKSMEQLNLTKNESYYKLRKAFVDLYMTQEKIKLAKKIKKRKSQNIKFIKLKYKGGLEPKWSLDKARAEHAEILDEINQLIADQNSFRYELGNLLGIPSYIKNSNVQLSTKKILKRINFNTKSKTYSYPQLKILEQDYDMAKYNLKIAYSEFSPIITLAFENSLTKTDGNPDQEDRSITINLKIPLFDGFSSYNKVAANRYNIESYQHRKKALKHELNSRLHQAQQQYNSKIKRLPTSRKLLHAAKMRKIVINKQYRTGSKSFLNWEQAETKLIEAEKKEISVLQDALYAHAWLKYVSGTKLGDL